MSKTAIFYSFNSNKTKKAAEKMIEEFGENNLAVVNAEELTEARFMAFDNYILGIPTWFDGELPNYWDEFVPALEDLDLSGKTFAIFGLGDQKGYPENFGDAVGIMASLIENRGGKIIGFTSAQGYNFESSKALKEGRFCGLILDQENQARLSGERIKNWLTEIKKEFR